MNKTESLKELFDEWRQGYLNDNLYSVHKLFCPNISQKVFVEDGIISEEDYNPCEIKVLYLLNEANIDKYIKDESFFSQITDYLNYIKANNNISATSDIKSHLIDDWKPSYLRTKITEMQRVICGNQLSLSDSAKTFAIMNINKSGGDKTISSSYLNDYLIPYSKEYKQYIHREINIINPDLIVWCGKNTYNPLFELVIPNEYKDKVINIIHPSARLSKDVNEYEQCICQNINVKRYIQIFSKQYESFKLQQSPIL